MFVTRAKYEALNRRYGFEVERRETAEKDAADRLALCTRLANQVSDLRDELTDPTGVMPATPPATEVEMRLRQELRRSEKAREALDADRLELIRINDSLNQQLRQRAEGTAA